MSWEDFPGGTVGGHGFDPWSWEIPRAMGQLSPHTTTPEAHAPRAWALSQENPLQSEAMHCDKK